MDASAGADVGEAGVREDDPETRRREFSRPNENRPHFVSVLQNGGGMLLGLVVLDEEAG